MSLTLKEVINAIDSLSSEDRELLYDSLRYQHLAEIEAEILASRSKAQQAIVDGAIESGITANFAVILAVEDVDRQKVK